MYLVVDNEIVAQSSEANLINYAVTLDCDYELVEDKGDIKKSPYFKKI